MAFLQSNLKLKQDEDVQHVHRIYVTLSTVIQVQRHFLIRTSNVTYMWRKTPVTAGLNNQPTRYIRMTLDKGKRDTVLTCTYSYRKKREKF